MNVSVFKDLKKTMHFSFMQNVMTRIALCWLSPDDTTFIRHGYKYVISLALFFFMLGLSGIGQTAELSNTEKHVLLSQGSDFFQQATETSRADPTAARELYQKAVLRFERLVAEGGINNGKLFYNIGNIHFQLKDIGRAVLNYRRAELYLPNDANLKKNLTFAQSMRQDRFEIKQQKKILKTLFFFHYDLSAQTRTIIFAIFYVCFWVFAGLKIFSRRPFTSWGLGITLLIAVVFGGSLLSGRYFSSDNLQGVLLDAEVTARQGDSHSYQPSFKDPLHAGTEFHLLDERDAWWQIELADGRTCWIPAQSGELVNRTRL
jgi:tetratricopeptide (TPR) repeat protein